MSATLGAALKKIAVALLSDRRNWEKIAVALFAVLLLFLLPILSVEAIFQADMDWDSPELVSAVLEELDVGSLGFLESSNNILTQLQTALKEAGFGFDEFRKAQALYWLALSPFSEESDFIEKLVGCFAPEQTNEELVANVNAAFGTDIDPEEFEKILATTASDMVAIAQSQIGQTGGQPYWSWYGFGSRVEWCAIFVILVRKPVWLHRRGHRPQVRRLRRGRAVVSKPGPVAPRLRHPRTGDAHFLPVVRQRFQHRRPCGHRGESGGRPGLHHRGQRG